MIKVIMTDRGYGVLETTKASILIRDLKHNQAIAYARDYQKLEAAKNPKAKKEKPLDARMTR